MIKQRTKHIRVLYHWIRDIVNDEEILLVFIAGSDNASDIMMKNVGTPKREHLPNLR